MDGISVRRLTVDCAVPRDHPNPLLVRTKLDDAAERLSDALARLLAPLSRAGDEVIVIPRLELTFDLDTSLSPDDLARAWAARIAVAVARSLAPESRVPSARFADEAHYLGRFLADSTGARATGAWWYRRWRGLDALPLEAQLRTALTDDPDRGIAALATLTRSELAAVLTALGPREARRVIETVIATSPGGGVETVARVLVTGVAEWVPLARSLPSAWQAALALVARVHAALQPGELRPVMELAAALAAAVAARSAGPSPSASPPLAPRSPPTALVEIPSIEPLLGLSVEARRALLAAAGIGDIRAEDAVVATTPEAGWYTRLGGLLLLLPRIAELPLDDVFGGDAGCARLAVLAFAAGRDQRAEVLHDPLWRYLCDVPPESDVQAWLASEDVAGLLAPHVWKRAARHAGRLRLVVTRHARSLVAVTSEPDGEWLAIAPLASELRTMLRGSHATHELAVAVSHAAARTAADALAWLGPDLASPSELAFAVAAQQILRAFARRLPGFAGSSLPFLHHNFLDFDATVLETGGTFHCRIGRARLATVFGLTGALRGRLPIGAGRGLELYVE